ncbi:MAG: hypothetical protein ABI834_07800 [Ginsengibacter sp.]
MKNKLLLKIVFSALMILLTGVSYQAKAQIVIRKTEKKSKSGIFFPKKKTHYPVVIRNENRLPPGQEKKIYGERSAKRFAPGQRKKAYNKNGKHWKHHDD